MLMLEAANGDPLRAQQIEDELRRDWWYYWLTYAKEKSEAASEKGD